MPIENKRIETAIVLAGGKGLRLRPLTDDCPKPMIKLLGKPILEWILEWLRHYGIKMVVLGVAYKKEVVMQYFGDGSNFGLSIVYSTHSAEAETGDGFNLAIERYIKDGETFLAMNGDEIAELNLHELVEFHFKNNTLATVVTSPLRSPYGVVDVDKENNVTSFVEKPTIESILVSTGTYIFNKGILPYISRKGSIERQTFPLLAKIGQLKAYKLKKEWITINTLKDLKVAEKKIIQMERY